MSLRRNLCYQFVIRSRDATRINLSLDHAGPSTIQQHLRTRTPVLTKHLDIVVTIAGAVTEPCALFAADLGSATPRTFRE